MQHRLTSTALAVATLFSVTSPAFAADDDVAVLVTATRITQRDADATFASEIHTRKQIEQSGASNLLDYLSQHSSVVIAPNFGNRHTPQIDMRGYGLSNGYQNIVVTVDGVRLNNIDLAPPLLGGIALAGVDRIEITKGSGSVLLGDGAAAGTIQIHTRKVKGGNVDASIGAFGAFNATASAGTRVGMVDLDANASRSNFDGVGKEDSTGHSDRSTSSAWRVATAVTPMDSLKFKLGANRAMVDTRYSGNLSQAQFDRDPRQNNGSPYTHQKLDSTGWNAGAEYWVTPATKLNLDHFRDDRHSEFVGSFVADYEYAGTDVGAQYREGKTSVSAGLQVFDGRRIGTTNETSKDSTAAYLQAQHGFDRLTLSAGARSEKVEYAYVPNAGSANRADHRLRAYDFGANLKVNERLSLFTNVNRAYQAPDIDRFFDFGGAFNAFIDPMKVTTLNAGANLTTTSHRLKVAIFRANLENEIYLYTPTFTNTNIDKSHKYGLEVQDTWRPVNSTALSVKYNHTRAIIDSEDRGAGAYNGKDLPGVSRHTVNLGAQTMLSARTAVSVAHAWRSSTWAADDLDNNNSQRQRAYSSTDVGITHRAKDDLEFYASIENVFGRKNGFWVDDNVVYPTNVTTIWRAGMRATF